MRTSIKRVLTLILAVAMIMSNMSSVAYASASDNQSETQTETQTQAETKAEAETTVPAATEKTTEAKPETERETAKETEATEAETTKETQQATEAETQKVTEADVTPMDVTGDTIETEETNKDRAPAKATRGTDDAKTGAPVALDTLTSSIKATPSGSVDSLNRTGTIGFDLKYVIDDAKLAAAKKASVWTYDISSLLTGDNAIFSNIVDGANGEIYDGGNNYAGTYTISNGIITLDVTKDYLAGKTKDVQGTFKLSCTLDSEKIGTASEKEVSFPGGTDLTLHFKETEVQTDKTVNGYSGNAGSVFMNADGTITYKVTFKATANLDTLVMTDTLGAGQTIVGGKVKVQDQSNWVTKEVDVNPGSDGVFTVDVKTACGSIKANTTYLVEYTVKVADAGWGTTLTNSSSWTWNGETTTADTTQIKPVKAVSSKAVVKSQTVTQDSGKKVTTFTYTLTIGDGSTNLNGYKIKDIISDNQKLVGTTIKIMNGSTEYATITPNTLSGNSNTEVTFFEYTFSKDVKGPFTITYQTTNEGSELNNGNNVTNKLETTTPGGDKETDTGNAGNVDYGVGKGKAEIEKVFDKFDTANNLVYWKISVKLQPGQTLTNAEVRESEYQYGNQYSQNTDMTLDWTKVSVLKADGETKYTGRYTVDAANNKILFPTLAESLVILVPAVYTPGFANVGSDGVYFKNRADLYEGNTQIDWGWNWISYMPDYQINKYPGNYDSTKSEVTWKVEVNKQKKTFDPDKTVFIMDNLPEDMTYVEDSFYYVVNENWGTRTYVEPTKVDGKLKFELGTLSGKYYYCEYQAKVADTVLESKEFTNTAELHDEGGKLAEDSGSITVNRAVLTKSSGNLSVDQIPYTVEINKEGLDLDTGDTVTVSDTLPDSVDLFKKGTSPMVSFVDAQENTVEGASYIYLNHVLTLTVPDSTYVKVTYWVKVKELGIQEISNTVNYVGKVSQIKEDKKWFDVTSHGATISAAADTITFIKTAQDGVTKLKDAKFAVYQVGYDEEGTLATPVTFKEDITDDDGSLVVNGLSYDTLYCWKETEAPPDYEISDLSTHYFIIYGEGSKDSITAKMATVEKKNNIKVTISAGAVTAQVSDLKIDKGSLTVKKTFAGAALTDAQKNAISFTVTGPLNYSQTFTYAQMTNGERKLSDLITGSYTVTESNTAVDGYTVVTTYKVGTGEAVTGTAVTAAVAADTDTKVELTNTYTQNVGNLEITKNFGAATPLTDAQKAAISFSVSGPNSYSNTFTYEEMTDGVKTLTGLAIGEYTVTESNAAADGYTLVTTYKVNDADSTEAKATVVKDETAKVELLNTYTQDVGSLEITKNFGAATPLTDAQKAAISFSVSGPNSYSNTFTYEEMTDGVKTLTGLAIGEYTVTESNAAADGYTLVTTYKVNDADSTEAKATVVKDETAKVELLNTYTQDVGSLEITKNFGAATPLTDAQKAAISFSVSGPNSYSNTFTYEEMTDGVKTLTGLAIGEYTVTESNAAADGYTLVTTYKVNDADSTEAKATVVKDETAKVELLNTYTQDVGSLEITKNFGAATPLTDAQKAAISFSVSGPNSYSNTFTYEEMTDGSMVLENLPVGDYTVTETNAGKTNYTLVTTYKVNGTTATEAKASVTKGGDASIELVNTYTQDKGKLTVKKSFGAGTPLTEAEKAAISFTVTGPDGYSNTFTYAEMTDGSMVLEGLPVGDYTVTETNAGADGYTLVTTYKVNDVNSSVATATVKKGGMAKVELTNTYSEIHVNVNKTDATGDKEVAGATITLYKATDINEDGSIKNGAKAVDSWVSAEKEVHDFGSKVEAGGSYVLVETNAPTGYAYTANIPFSIDEKGNVSCNNKAEDGTILVKDAALVVNVNKTDATGDKEVAGATITLYKATDINEDGSIKDGAEAVDSWVSAEKEVYDFGSKVEAGGSYVLVETNAPTGYAYTANIPFSIDEKGNVSCNNKAEDGTILVKDAALVVNVNKMDATGDEEVAGATITLYKAADINEDGSIKDGAEAVDSWVSAEKEVYDFGSKVEAGGSYVLVETNAPTGYAYTANIPFSIDEKGNVSCNNKAEDGTILVKDAALVVNVNKMDATGDKEVAGATITLYKAADINEDGSIKAGAEAVDSWVSAEKEVHDFGSKVEAGGSYVLVETNAPTGYAYTANIPFSIAKDGTVTCDNKAEDGTILVKDAALVVNVNKMDATGDKEVAGATITLYKAADINEDGSIKAGAEAVDSWVSAEKEVHDFGSKVEAGGSYVLVETNAPTGYAYTANIPFSIDEKGNVSCNNKAEDGTILVKDAALVVNVNKMDATGDKEVAGATITLYKAADINEDGSIKAGAEAVDSWVSAEKEVHDFGSKVEAGGSYVLVETNAPTGYAYTANIPFSIAKDGTVTCDNKAEDGTILVKDAALVVNVNKMDATGDKEVAGATITLYKATDINEDGSIKDGAKAVDSWVSAEKEVHDFGSKVEAGGSYVLVETNAPTGYAYTANIPFSIAKDGTVTCDNKAEDGTILVKDTALTFTVNKTDLVTDAEVEGAVITIYKQNEDGTKGDKVDSWTSKKDETHDFGSLLETGNTYVLEETTAPTGYAFVSDTTFTIDKDGSVTTELTKTEDSEGNSIYLVEDSAIHFTVNKTDLGTGAELAGAVLTVYEKEEAGTLKEVASWTSAVNETHDFGSVLDAGKSYVLRETAAPSGYAYASDIEFSIANDGTVTCGAVSSKDSDGNTIYLVQDEATTGATGQITVTKKATLLNENNMSFDLYATDATFYVALFEDEAGTHRISDVQALYIRNAISGSTTFTNLLNKTYYVFETTADGTAIPYNTASTDTNGKSFTCVLADGTSSTVEIDTDAAKTEGMTSLENRYVDLPQGFYYAGTLEVEKQVKKDGETYTASGEHFYAGVFDAEGNLVEVLELEQNGSVSRNYPLPEDGSSVTYTVMETDKDGIPVDSDFKYDVTIDNETVTMSRDELSAKTTITNSITTETESETQTETTKKTTTTTTTTTAAKTGDDTPIWLYVFLLMGAGGCLILNRRKKKA